MKRLTKLLSLLLIVVTLSSCFLVGCGKAKNKTYDVTIKVKCSTGEEWVFTPDVDTLYWEIDYDGIERTFHVDKYKMEKHPRYGDIWFDPSPYAPNCFESDLLYRAPGEKNKTIKTPVLDIGEYCYSANTSSTTNMWKFRAIYLYITVK